MYSMHIAILQNRTQFTHNKDLTSSRCYCVAMHQPMLLHQYLRLRYLITGNIIMPLVKQLGLYIAKSTACVQQFFRIKHRSLTSKIHCCQCVIVLQCICQCFCTTFTYFVI